MDKLINEDVDMLYQGENMCKNKSMFKSTEQSLLSSSDMEEQTKKSELLARLNYTQNKLKQYNQTVSKSWCPDPSLFSQEENTTDSDQKLPHQVQENISDIIQSAQEYITKLEEQIKDLDSADQLIENSAIKTVSEIDDTYEMLLKKVYEMINKKKEMLKLEAQIRKNESLLPLKACRQEVNAQIQNAQQLIALIEVLLQNPQTFTPDRFNTIITASNNIGRIPAVPFLEELPHISFNCPSNSDIKEILNRISDIGSISRVGPVQITDIEERPAGLFIKWTITDPEYTGEDQTFVVEKAHGEILDPADNTFETTYIGSMTYCFVQDLPISQPITLRVKPNCENVAWSTHKISQTTIPSYNWALDNENYMITNHGKVAAKITNDISTLFSQNAQYDINYIIEFKFLETAHTGSDDEGIALVSHPQGKDDILKRPGSLLITPSGKIFMDGVEKLMQLPKIRFGTGIVFTATRRDSNVLRINIECTDKVVTYDWNIETPLYFAARFAEFNKWNIMVK